MADAGVTRPAVTLDVVKLWAKMQMAPQVIASVVDPSRWLIVMPGGSVFGTGFAPMGQVDAEECAWHVAATRGYADPVVIVTERVGE